MMKRVLLACVAGLVLAACNEGSGSVERVPAHNAKLAALGWKENAKPFPLGQLDTTINHALFCKSEKCGGPSGYLVGEATLSSSSTFGHLMQTIEDSPEMDNARLSQELVTGSAHQRDLGINVESVRKNGKQIVLVANAAIPLGGQNGTGVFHITVDGMHMRLEAGVGADRAAAMSMFKYASYI